MTVEEKALRMVKAAPPLTDAELEQINALYPAYLFRVRREREIWTSCCGRHEVVPRGEVTDAFRAVLEAPHHPEPKLFPAYSCHCGYMSAPAPRREPELIPCPFCGRLAKVKELGRTGNRDNLAAYRRAVVLRWYRGALWARAYGIKKRYGGEGALTGKPEAKLCGVYRFVPGKASCADRSYWAEQWSGHAEMRGRPEKLPIPIGEPFPWSWEDGMGYDVIGAEELEKSPFRWCGFERFLEESGSAMKFLALCTLYPRQVEMLMKAGLVETVKDLVDRGKWNAAAFDWNEPDPMKAFGLSKPELRQFLTERYPMEVLVAYKGMKRAGVPASMVALAELWEQAEGAKRYRRIVGRMKRYCIKPDKLLRYIERQADKPCGKGKYSASKQTLTTEWLDYLEAAELLRPGARGALFLFPGELKESHDKATKAAVEIRAAVGNEKYKKSRLPVLAKKYTFSLGRWLIRPPVSAEEIIAEGKALKHCVGNYAGDHIKGSTTILFLRNREHPHKPFVTMEVQGDKIVQIHGYDDDRKSHIDQRKAHAEVLEPWLAWVAAGSKRDKKGRPKTKRGDAREQGSKPRSGANGPEAPEGPQDGLRSRRCLDPVAEGVERDKLPKTHKNNKEVRVA